MNAQTLLAVLAMDETRNVALDESLKLLVPKSDVFQLFWIDNGDGEPRYSFPTYNEPTVFGGRGLSGEWLFYLTTKRDGQQWVSCSDPIPTDKSDDKEFVSAAIAKAIEQMQGCKL